MTTPTAAVMFRPLTSSTRLRSTTASSSAHAASAAEKRKAVRKLRVIVLSIVAITSSRTAATSLS